MTMQRQLLEQHTNENIQELDLDHLNVGNYVVKISGRDFLYSKKNSCKKAIDTS
jgi:hypothetical protein